MYCPKCGNKQDGNEKFCSKCGTEYPSSDDYSRTIPTNKEKMQQTVEKGKDTAKAFVSKGLEISSGLTKKASEQAKQIGENIQTSFNEHGKGHYIEFIKKHKLSVIGVCACLLLFSTFAVSKYVTDDEYYDDEYYDDGEYEDDGYEGYDEDVDYRQYVNGNSIHITADFTLQGTEVIDANSNCFVGNPVICGSSFGEYVQTPFVYVPSDETWIFRNVEAYCLIEGMRMGYNIVGIIVNNTRWNKGTSAEYHDLVIHPNDRVAILLSRPTAVQNGRRGEFHIIMNATINH